MNIYGNVEEKEAKVIAVLGCKKSLKDFAVVGKKLHFEGAILDNEVRKTADEEYTTNYVKVVDCETGEVMWCKFTQTVISNQLKDLFDNGLTDMLDFELGYCESASGNRYLCISL